MEVMVLYIGPAKFGCCFQSTISTYVTFLCVRSLLISLGWFSNKVRDVGYGCGSWVHEYDGARVRMVVCEICHVGDRCKLTWMCVWIFLLCTMYIHGKCLVFSMYGCE